MPQYSYINGRFIPASDASISLQDRGLLFADSIYEVVCLMDGEFVDLSGHMKRLERSCDQIKLDVPYLDVLPLKIFQLATKNKLENGLVYIQISRGSSARDFPFPKGVRPNIFMLSKRLAKGFYKTISAGVKVISVQDIRWKRRDIKTTNLLPPVLAKQEAYEQGAKEAWLVDEDGFVTEGASSNAWIVSKEGKLVTRQTDTNILSGVTRSSLIKIAGLNQIETEIRPFTIEEAYQAKEAFLSSATTFATPIIQINDKKIGNGKAGPLTQRLLDQYILYGQTAEKDYEWTAPF